MHQNDEDDEVNKLLKILERKSDKKLVFTPPSEKKVNKKAFKKKKQRQVARNKTIYEFIQFKRWTKGDNFYSAFSLFKLYQEWADNYSIQKTVYTTFLGIMKLNFETKLTNKNIVFIGINEKII